MPSFIKVCLLVWSQEPPNNISLILSTTPEPCSSTTNLQSEWLNGGLSSMKHAISNHSETDLRADYNSVPPQEHSVLPHKSHLWDSSTLGGPTILVDLSIIITESSPLWWPQHFVLHLSVLLSIWLLEHTMLTKLSLKNSKKDTRVSGMPSKGFPLSKDLIIFSKTPSHFSSNTASVLSLPSFAMIGWLTSSQSYGELEVCPYCLLFYSLPLSQPSWLLLSPIHLPWLLVRWLTFGQRKTVLTISEVTTEKLLCISGSVKTYSTTIQDLSVDTSGMLVHSTLTIM